VFIFLCSNFAFLACCYTHYSLSDNPAILRFKKNVYVYRRFEFIPDNIYSVENNAAGKGLMSYILEGVINIIVCLRNIALVSMTRGKFNGNLMLVVISLNYGQHITGLSFFSIAFLESRYNIGRSRRDIQPFPETQFPLSLCYRSIWSRNTDAEFRN